MSLIPSSVIGVVSLVIGGHYYSHSTLNSLFMSAGAPGDVPDGNCVRKCAEWLKRCNEEPSVDAIEVLGKVIQELMDKEPTPPLFGKSSPSPFTEDQEKIHAILAKNNLSYRLNGHITNTGSAPLTKTLEERFKSGDFSSIEIEFERAVQNISKDPHAAITAASAIIESVLKVYIEKFGLSMPRRLNVMDLWDVVRPELNLNSDGVLAGDQQKILRGLTASIDGVGCFRSHIGSAHGRGNTPPSIIEAETRLAVNVSHTIVIFVMDYLRARNDP